MFERETLEVYKYCNIRSFPIDCDVIIKRLGYRVVTYQDYARGDKARLIELMKVSNDAFIVRQERTLYLNVNTDRRRQRFTKSHEIGHIVLLTDSEEEADMFAASLLAPLIMVKKSRPFNVDGICQNFDVSVAMANRTIVEAMHYPIFQPGATELFEYFKQFRPKKKQEKRVAKSNKVAEKYPDNWNELMLIKHDMDLYFY